MKVGRGVVAVLWALTLFAFAACDRDDAPIREPYFAHLDPDLEERIARDIRYYKSSAVRWEQKYRALAASEPNAFKANRLLDRALNQKRFALGYDMLQWSLDHDLVIVSDERGPIPPMPTEAPAEGATMRLGMKLGEGEIYGVSLDAMWEDRLRAIKLEHRVVSEGSTPAWIAEFNAKPREERERFMKDNPHMGAIRFDPATATASLPLSGR